MEIQNSKFKIKNPKTETGKHMDLAAQPSPFLRPFLFLLATMLVCGSIFTLAPALLGLHIWEGGSREYLLFVQSFSQIGMYLIPGLLFALLIQKPSFSFLTPQKQQKAAYFLFPTLAWIFILPFISWSNFYCEQIHFPEALQHLEERMRATELQLEQLMNGLLNVSSWSGLTVNLLCIALLPALAEEFFFRGSLQSLFLSKTKRIHLSVWITAIIFSFIHFQFYGFIARTLLGALLGYAFAYSGSIWAPVCIHFLNNAMAVTLDFLHRNEYMQISPDQIDQTLSHPFLGFLLLPISVLFIVKLQHVKSSH